MPEVAIVDLVDNFWDNYLQEVPEEYREKIDQWLNQADPGPYQSPSEENPIPASQFVYHLDTSFMEPILQDAYPRYDSISERMPPRVRFLAYFALSRANSLKEAFRAVEPEEFFKMGFEEPPNYELLRVFVYEKVRRDRLKTVFEMIIQEIVTLARKKKLPIGQRIGEDATDAPALKHDPEAKYSGYYKEWGWKVDVVHDLDHETLPLDYSKMELTDDEGKCLAASYNQLEQYDLNPEEWKVDGSYATYQNISLLETQSTHLVYRIQDGWVENSKGTYKAIQARYQSYHRRDDFIVTRDIDVMLRYLHARGDTEWVGAYYRNQAMQAQAEDPEGYRDQYNERSGKTEGIIGTIKDQTNLSSRLPRRGRATFEFRADMSMLAYAFAALIRLQNNDTERLGNLTYIY